MATQKRRRVVARCTGSLDTERAGGQMRRSAPSKVWMSCVETLTGVSSWGEWRQPGKKRPASALENNVLARALPDRGGGRRLPENAVSLDGATNPWSAILESACAIAWCGGPRPARRGGRLGRRPRGTGRVGPRGFASTS